MYVYTEYDEPHSLIVLAEEELVAIDLDSDKWPSFQLPYINSLHSSAITCSQHVSNVPEQLWTKIVDVGQAQMSVYSKRASIDVNSKQIKLNKIILSIHIYNVIMSVLYFIKFSCPNVVICTKCGNAITK